MDEDPELARLREIVTAWNEMDLAAQGRALRFLQSKYESALKAKEISVTDRATPVTQAVAELLPQQAEWSVRALMAALTGMEVQARSKEVYNALGYLTRTRKARKLGYGRYASCLN